ncbi:tape measure protein [Pseudorhodoferax sp. LjRoot39]|uniref:tape measure protein n=1 Tax=Pseudorhodoferax sp. LjRoot39 TaxID=3342328 RepID=UPI003ECD20E0
MSEKVGEIYYDVTLDTRGMIDGQRRVSRELESTNRTLTAAAAAVAALAAAYASLHLAKLADEFRLLGARVEVAAGSMESGSAAFAELVKISRQTQSSLAGNIEVFTRLNQSILQMGGTQRDTLIVTELLAKAIKVSGASAVEAKAAMLQFGQALGSGKLQGDELRSLMETAPYLMRQLADGIGVPVGALKKLGEEGKLTADVVTNALTQAAAKIDADFKKFPQTIESAMVVAQDSAALAALKFDELSGSSAALTGVVKGVGEVLDKLADQFGAANDEAGTLGRNTAVKGWADTSREAISYLIDAADVVWQTLSVLGRNVAFVFTGVGKEIGGIGAQVMAVLRGDFAGAKAISDAMVADSEQRRKALDAADAKTLSRAKTAGQAMRDAWEQGAGGGRGSVNPTPAASKLKPPVVEEKKPKKAKAEKFDEEAYMASLRIAQASEINVVNETETEKLRIAKKNLDEKKISETAYAEAVKLINQAAEDDRVRIMARAQEKIDRDREKSDKEAADAREKNKREQEKAIEYAANLTRAINPVDALRQEYEAKLQLVTQYEGLMAQAGVDITEQGLLARAQLESQYQLQRTALAEQTFRSQNEANAFLIDSLNALSSSATGTIMGLIDGTMTAQEAMRGLATTVLNEAVSALVQIGVQQVKNALLGDTLAAADKAKKAANGAVYAASIGAQVTGMSALAAQNAFAATAAIPIIGPALAPAAAAAAGAAAAGLGAPALATAPLAGARQYGGPVSAGGMYRVNETGAPEMFTGSNGQQYMLPTKSGQVTAADQVGGNPEWKIIINQAPPGTTATVDQTERTVKIAIGEIASQFRSNEGEAWSALRGASNVRGAL